MDTDNKDTDTVEFPADYGELLDIIANDGQRTYEFQLKACAVGERILKAHPQEQRRLVLAMSTWLVNGGRLPAERASNGLIGMLEAIFKQGKPPKMSRQRSENVRAAMFELLRRKLPFTENDVLALLTWSGKQKYWHDAGLAQMTRVVENYLAEHALTPELQCGLQCLVGLIENEPYKDSDMRRHAATFKQLGQLQGNALPLIMGEVWADQAVADVLKLDADCQATWTQLLTHCGTASGGKPTKKWSIAAHALLDQLGFDQFQQQIAVWFPLVDKPRLSISASNRTHHHPFYMDEINGDILKGMVWLCAEREDREVARLLSALAVSAYRKLPGVGPRAVKVGNACVWALGEMPGLAAVGQLAILKTRVKFGTAQGGIEKALHTAAERQGISRAEIEEMAVPEYGLTGVGVRRETLGEFTAELMITGTTSTELRWFKPDGKEQKSIPKRVKDEYAEELSELKQAAKNIQKMLPAQRDRIDSLFLAQKQWPVDVWRERYLEHHLVGTLARRIIWHFTQDERSAAGIWHEGAIVDQQGRTLDWIDDTTTVRLWHPIEATTETVVAWRHWLIQQGVQQPFKQAYRELYLLTDAERNTRVYSNRFAAHILKQHQFNALCGARGWKNQLRLMVDDEYSPAMRFLPQWDLRAEFWIEGIGDHFGTDTTETGTYLYLTTDQVRFYQVDATENSAHAGGGGYHAYGFETPQPIPLEEIPPLVLTEVLRDVDLFVGVASIGNDPSWVDGGEDRPHTGYWRHYAFGDLSEAAKTRKATLEALLPALKMRDRFILTEKFLVVRGDLRTYKIHLGSGNILMEPNDQYLCIVPAQGAAKADTGKLYLPFEGDNMLAIILSKALLLAADTKVTDTTILQQIRRLSAG
ncbi:MAG: DUF4132 domain-containing protein [Caldilineaceae bacterium]